MKDNEISNWMKINLIKKKILVLLWMNKYIKTILQLFTLVQTTSLRKGFGRLFKNIIGNSWDESK